MEFEDRWTTLQISDAAQKGGLKTGPFGAQLKAEEYVDAANGIPVVMPKDIRAGEIVLDTIAKVTGDKAEKLSNHKLEDGDILFPRRGELGRIGLVSKTQSGWLCGTGCLRLRLNQKTIPSFVATTLQRNNSVQWLESNAVGQTMLNLNTSIIGDLVIGVPTLPEQRKVADFLTAVDGRIGQLTQKKALLEDYKKGVMQQLFTEAIRFKDDHGNDFPDWEEKKLGEVAIKVGSGSTPTGGSKVYQESGVLFVRSQNVNNNVLDLSNPTFISPVIHEKMKGSTVRPRDVLLNITGASIGRSCVVPEDFSTGNVNQHVCIIRPNNELSPLFLQLFLSSYWGQKLIIRGQAGGGREGLNFQSIRIFKIPCPSLTEQTKIADFLSAIDRKIESIATQITETQTFKRGLLQQMFV